VPDVLTDRYQTPWGEAINFDGADCALVRRYFIDNALFWLHEFHIDGLRLDATHEMFDAGRPHILREIADAVHERFPTGKRCLLVAEDRGNELRLVAPPEAGGYGFDGMWVDDFHHAVYVRLTGQREGYLGAYTGSNEEIARLLNEGLLYSSADGVASDAAAKVAPSQLIYCLQNHDQVGNGPFGLRLAKVVGGELYKAAYALLLLVPGTPLIFMGDEFAASTPFLYFTELDAELAQLTKAGRSAEFRAFWATRATGPQELPEAQDEATFLQSKLKLGERDQPPHAGILHLFRELLALRRNDNVFRVQDRARLRADAASDKVLTVERWSGAERRLLAVNFGDGASLTREGAWRPVLCTAEARFAGLGVDLGALRIGNGDSIELPGGSASVWASEDAG
jgi:maltooligosyltrehalose trehalohydrolase